MSWQERVEHKYVDQATGMVLPDQGGIFKSDECGRWLHYCGVMQGDVESALGRAPKSVIEFGSYT